MTVAPILQAAQRSEDLFQIVRSQVPLRIFYDLQ